MVQIMSNDYGNPSSTHGFGRSAKSILELSRKSIAKHFNVSAQEIILLLREPSLIIDFSAVVDLKVKRIITSKIEHHAVLDCFNTTKEFDLQVDFVAVKPNGAIDLTNLVELLSQDAKTMVSLMHVNNEIGTVLDLERVGIICNEHQVLFHQIP
jgi:cysteine desulfurase